MRKENVENQAIFSGRRGSHTQRSNRKPKTTKQMPFRDHILLHADCRTRDNALSSVAIGSSGIPISRDATTHEKN